MDFQLIILIPTHNNSSLSEDVVKPIILASKSLDYNILILVSSTSVLKLDLDISIPKNVKIFFRRIHHSNFWCMNVNNSLDFIKDNFNFDFLLLLNDDSKLSINNLSNFIKNIFVYDYSILVGKIYDSKGKLIFGARNYSFLPFKFILSPSKTKFVTFNANVVGFSRKVLDKLINFGNYSHAFGDFDFGLRATKNGINIIQYPDCIGVSEENSNLRLSKFKKHEIIGFGRSNYKDSILFYYLNFPFIYFFIFYIYINLKRCKKFVLSQIGKH